jgi:IS5 family transposase
LLFFLTAGQVSDYTGARHLLDHLPKARELLADRDYDADWFRNGLKDKGISPCIPPRKKRKHPAEYDKRSTSNDTASRTCSAGSRTGGASPHDMIDAPTHSSRPSSLPQHVAIGSINES